MVRSIADDSRSWWRRLARLTVDVVRAKRFYAGTLGLGLVAEDEFALMFDANGTPLRVAAVREMAPAPYTVLGWQVRDIVAAVKELQNAGIVFERYVALMQDDNSIWTAPGGAKVAWFKDPDRECVELFLSTDVCQLIDWWLLWLTLPEICPIWGVIVVKKKDYLHLVGAGCPPNWSNRRDRSNENWPGYARRTECRYCQVSPSTRRSLPAEKPRASRRRPDWCAHSDRAILPIVLRVYQRSG